MQRPADHGIVFLLVGNTSKPINGGGMAAPVYRVGDLVNPNPQYLDEDNPLAVGMILEVRHMRPRAAEVRVLWNDIEGDPVWTPINEVLTLKWQACNGPDDVV